MATLRSQTAHLLLAALFGAAAPACAPSSVNTEAAAADRGAAQPTKAEDALYAWEGTIKSEKIYEGAPQVSGFQTPAITPIPLNTECDWRKRPMAKCGQFSLTTPSHRHSS